MNIHIKPRETTDYNIERVDVERMNPAQQAAKEALRERQRFK